MKATLASIACLLVAGFLAAASVDGNNKAVVIQKTVVQSSNNYQFLCVPVDGLQIDGQTGSKISVETFLPASTCTASTVIWTVSSEGKSTRLCTRNSDDNNPAWVADGSADLNLAPGTILWVKKGPVSVTNPTSLSGLSLTTADTTETADNTQDETITFCGQERSLTSSQTSTAKLNAMMNDGATAIKISDFATTFGVMIEESDEILVLKAGTTDYCHYRTDGTKWFVYDSTAKKYVEVTDANVIAPGEAFYFHNMNGSN